ncbi:MAG: hypothetical protein U0Q15_01300 [Kineosporiaceae bacterium]
MTPAAHRPPTALARASRLVRGLLAVVAAVGLGLAVPSTPVGASTVAAAAPLAASAAAPQAPGPGVVTGHVSQVEPAVTGRAPASGHAGIHGTGSDALPAPAWRAPRIHGVLAPPLVRGRAPSSAGTGPDDARAPPRA